MNVGVSVPLPAYHVDVAFMARKAEELGFESFWCAEHPFIPVRTTSRFPGSADGVIPESYSHFIDPFVALARASGVTTRVKLGTGIVLVPERNPLLLAKEISTLDLFSGGRFVFGIGAGWLPNRITPDQLRESRQTLDRLAKDAGRNPSAITISVHGQSADRDLIKRLHDAGANRVIVRPPSVKTESEMGTELTRIADAVLR